MLSFVKLLLGILGLAGLIAYGVQAKSDRPGHQDHNQPQRIITDPSGGTPGPP